MSPQQPTFQQGSHTVNQRQQVFANISRLTDNLMLITRGRQLAISSPTIRTDFIFGLNTLFNRGYQAIPGSVFNFVQSDSSGTFAFIFYRYNHQRFVRSPSAMFPRPGTTKIDFINLHRPDQVITARANHRSAQSVKHRPGCFISAKSQNALQSQRTNSMLLANHLPDSPKPQTQRQSGVLKDGPSRNRNLNIAVAAVKLSSASHPSFSVTTVRANKPFWPPHLTKICSARFFSVEILFELKQCLGIMFHPRILYLGVTGVNRISLLNISPICAGLIILKDINFANMLGRRHLEDPL